MMQILNLSHYLPLVVYPYAFLKPEVLFCTVRLFFFCVFCFVLFLAVPCGFFSPDQESCPTVPAAVEAWNPNHWTTR